MGAFTNKCTRGQTYQGDFYRLRSPRSWPHIKHPAFFFFMWHQDHDLFQRFLFAYFNFNS